MRSPLSRRGDEQSLERRAFLALQDVLDDPHSAQRCHPEEAKLTKDLAPGAGSDPASPWDTSAAFRLRRRGALRPCGRPPQAFPAHGEGGAKRRMRSPLSWFRK